MYTDRDVRKEGRKQRRPTSMEGEADRDRQTDRVGICRYWVCKARTASAKSTGLHIYIKYWVCKARTGLEWILGVQGQDWTVVEWSELE
jgi:hypothetical protein